ncbi:hypothetical protein A7W90_16255 [Clostridium sp. Bc-iso-3]|nr:hypothetical protein A7W90_16255 [Clostridium sp. Bc-iso-3]
MLYMWDGEKLVHVPILDRVIIYDALVMQIGATDVYTPLMVDLSDFSVDMQAMSDSVITTPITEDIIIVADTYTPLEIDLSSFNVGLGTLTENTMSVAFADAITTLEMEEKDE